MRALSPNSATQASFCLQLGLDDQATADALNLARPWQPDYEAHDIRDFRHPPQFLALQDWPPQNNAPFAPARVSSPVSHGAASMTQDELMRALIEQRNPQDFSGPPLPSGHSVDSRAMGSTQDSRYSDASGQHPPSSLASASRATVNPRREDRRMAAAPYPPSKSSGSGATTIDNGNCRHKPRVKINANTFIACSDTDDELKASDPKAINRVKVRKSRSKRAAELGLTSTAELHRLDADAHAAKNGHTSRQEARDVEQDRLAVVSPVIFQQCAAHRKCAKHGGCVVATLECRRPIYRPLATGTVTPL